MVKLLLCGAFVVVAWFVMMHMGWVSYTHTGTSANLFGCLGLLICGIVVGKGSGK
jgi:hypothetical protein